MPQDAPALRSAIVELSEHEHRLHPTRLPGEQIADAYLAWMQQRAAEGGAVLVAEVGGAFAGFVAGWIEVGSEIAETPDSNRFGYISDICVMPAHRGRRVANSLLGAIEQHLARAGIRRLRIASLAGNAPARKSYERAGFLPYEILYEKVVQTKRRYRSDK